MSKINYLKKYTIKDDVMCDVYQLHVRGYKLVNNVRITYMSKKLY
jgi:hypothetical protein